MPWKGQKCKLHYTREDVEKAIEKVRTGCLSYQQAHQIYGVQKSTISDQINRHSAKSDLNDFLLGKYTWTFMHSVQTIRLQVEHVLSLFPVVHCTIQNLLTCLW